MIAPLEFHELASLFPMTEGQQYTDLKADIQAHAVRLPIWTWQGKIIDGRNRYRACQELGIEPPIQEWDGKGSLVAFIWSLNGPRRHLSASQRAAIAAEIEPLLAREAAQRKEAALDRNRIKLLQMGAETATPKVAETLTQLIGEPSETLTQFVEQASAPVVAKLPGRKETPKTPVLKVSQQIDPPSEWDAKDAQLSEQSAQNAHIAKTSAATEKLAQNDLESKGKTCPLKTVRETSTRPEAAQSGQVDHSAKTDASNIDATVSILDDASDSAEAGRARDQAAKLTGASPRYVSDAKKLKQTNPEAFEKVKAGTLTLSRASRDATGDGKPANDHWTVFDGMAHVRKAAKHAVERLTPALTPKLGKFMVGLGNEIASTGTIKDDLE